MKLSSSDVIAFPSVDDLKRLTSLCKTTLAERTSRLISCVFPILRCLHCRNHKLTPIEIVCEQTQLNSGNKKSESRIFRTYRTDYFLLIHQSETKAKLLVMSTSQKYYYNIMTLPPGPSAALVGV